MTIRASLIFLMKRFWGDRKRESCLLQIALLVFVILQLALMWTFALDLHDANEQGVVQFSAVDIPPHQKKPRFILLNAKQGWGQGMGNWMHGLLAAHLLGMEFDRIVCATESYFPNFALGFQQKRNADLCEQETIRALLRNGTTPRIRFWNFESSSECQLKHIMASDHQTVIFSGNTYPKWARVPPRFFDWYYEPTEQLKSLFPWPKDHPPEIVVHLRKEDGARDVRKGLDNNTLYSLGTQLSAPENRFGSKPYLVTNYGLLADQMEQSFGWTGPHWNVPVKHSALNVAWNISHQHDNTNDSNDVRKDIPEKQLQTMMGWIDWFAIANAKLVHHTHSDFSSSAVHWMGSDEYIESHILWETDSQTGELIERDEAWVGALKREGSYPLPLIDRPENTLTDWKGKLCKLPKVTQNMNAVKGGDTAPGKKRRKKKVRKKHINL